MNLRCPACNSDAIHVTAEPYDHGTCPETGYDDSGVNYTWACLACGKSGRDVAGDLVVREAA